MKLQLSYRTIDDEIVRDSLTAIAQLSEPYMVVSGIAVQSYLPTSCRRPTADIDNAVVCPLAFDDFKQFTKPIVGFLESNGYSCSPRRLRHAYGILVEGSDPGAILIEFPRRNEKNLEKMEPILRRAFDNSRVKRVEEREATYVVACPEDLALPKLVRSINALTRNPELEKEVYRFTGKLSDEDVESILGYLSERREEAVYSIGDCELAQELRFLSDLYDIRILSEVTGFNEGYLREASRDWETLQERSLGREQLVHGLFGLDF